jgi:hypothetical protein
VVTLLFVLFACTTNRMQHYQVPRSYVSRTSPKSPNLTANPTPLGSWLLGQHNGDGHPWLPTLCHASTLNDTANPTVTWLSEYLGRLGFIFGLAYRGSENGPLNLNFWVSCRAAIFNRRGTPVWHGSLGEGWKEARKNLWNKINVEVNFLKCCIFS